jgi:outer membrane protein, multidrug efflux system
MGGKKGLEMPGRLYSTWVCVCSAGVMIAAGCKVGPDYHRPQVSVPVAWSGPKIGVEPNEASQQALVQWWTSFHDPTLTSLVSSAIQSNLDVRQAEARVLQARAVWGVAAGGLWPTLNAKGSATRSRSPIQSGQSGQFGGSSGVTRNLFQTGLDAAWELDLFGGKRRNVEAAAADVQAAEEDRRDVLVTLTAEVATTYINLRTAQQQVAVAENNLRAQKHVAELTRQRFEGGLASGLDVANAEAQTATTAAQIAPLQQTAQQNIYSLSVLLGREPGALLQDLGPASSVPTTEPAVPLVVPSELLRRRPDIRRAEAQIHAATARIGVAAADLFPKLSLSASAGFQGSQSGTWLRWPSRFWSAGPSATWPLFAGNSLRSAVEAQKALQEQSVLAYQKVVLTALQEVENALIALAREQEHREALVNAAAANRKALDLATRLYTQGQTDFLSVLQSQGALYAAEDALVRSDQAIATNLVALYKAMGGGMDG